MKKMDDGLLVTKKCCRPLIPKKFAARGDDTPSPPPKYVSGDTCIIYMMHGSGGVK